MSIPATENTTAESRTPRDIGSEMAALRAKFNLTPQEVSERLHIRTRYILAMEEGRYELMPGKVYARGYVHTYAEFLGLNADAVVKQCFAGETVAAAPHTPSISRPATARHVAPGQWRVYGVMTAILLVVVLAFNQIHTHTNAEPETGAVTPVPEEMLASVRNLVMPTPENYDCLKAQTLLSCFYNDAASRLLNGARNHRLAFEAPIDVSDLVIQPSDNSDAENEASVPQSKEKPAEKSLSTRPKLKKRMVPTVSEQAEPDMNEEVPQ